MEKLLSDVPVVASLIFPAGLPAKQLYICACSSLGELSETIAPTSRYFGLLLAMDARQMDTAEICDLAEKTLNRGLVYLCTWGPDCERVHDLFDKQFLTKELGPGPWTQANKPLSPEEVVMTTWHAHEALEEALWFFVHSAVPTDKYKQACTDWVIAIVDNAEWEQEVRTKIAKVASECLED
jgi:hypothetical protein